jgi:hypothetical protein
MKLKSTTGKLLPCLFYAAAKNYLTADFRTCRWCNSLSDPKTLEDRIAPNTGGAALAVTSATTRSALSARPEVPRVHPKLQASGQPDAYRLPTAIFDAVSTVPGLHLLACFVAGLSSKLRIHMSCDDVFCRTEIRSTAARPDVLHLCDHHLCGSRRCSTGSVKVRFFPHAALDRRETLFNSVRSG